QDPDSNHVGIDADGDLVSLAAAGVPGRFDDGNLRSVWVDYDGVLLEVRVSDTGVRPAVATLARIVDIPGVLGSEAGFVGFTAATFGAYGDHDIVSWSYQGTCGNLTIDGCDTGVENLLFTGGIQLSDLVNACAAQATAHGGFVSCVASLTNGLKQAGILTGRQKSAIQSCAAGANLP
ncbi:MAG: hypothetical protein KDM81_18405, partial [Verrucomicrobiae bacterium]|nr:hypothetical protein [Verrucomicrobiae bacterium]